MMNIIWRMVNNRCSISKRHFSKVEIDSKWRFWGRFWNYFRLWTHRSYGIRISARTNRSKSSRKMVTNVRETIIVLLELYFHLLRALQVVTGGLSELLNHVTSLKPLLHLKSSLVALMTEVWLNHSMEFNCHDWWLVGTYATVVICL